MPEASLGAGGVAPGTFSFRLGFGAGDGGLVIASIRNHSVGVFFWIMSESSSEDASSRFLPFIVRSSIVLIKVSVIRSWVCSEPPRIENLSALVILL